jgi:hypothetical protein
MNKRTFQIISLIFSIFALIYMFLVRYGFFRYYRLKEDSTEKYLEKYTSLEKPGKDKVVVAFSADEKSLSTIKPFINSILDQTIKVDDIAITIPEKEKDKIPEDMKKVLNIHTYNKDYDDAGNLILSVLREPEGETKIIILEPNVIYGEDFIQSIVEESESYPNSVIFADGKRGILVKPKFFDENLAEYQKGMGCCPWLEKCCIGDKRYMSYSKNYRI